MDRPALAYRTTVLMGSRTGRRQSRHDRQLWADGPHLTDGKHWAVAVPSSLNPGTLCSTPTDIGGKIHIARGVTKVYG